MDILTEIYGIGKSLAEELFLSLPAKTKTKDEIIKFLMQPKIYDNLPESTQQHLKYKPLTGFSTDLISDLEKKLSKIPGTLISGSFRRGNKKINDVDILTDSFEKIKHLFLEPYAIGEKIIRTFYPLSKLVSKEKEKGKKYLNVDIFIYEPGEYYTQLLYTTGSKNFNIIIRRKAKAKGYLLNQKGLYLLSNSEKVEINSEEEIFEKVGMNFLKPKERNF